MSQRVVDHLVVELTRLGVDGHAAEGELGVEVESDETVEDVELLRREDEHLVEAERVGDHFDVLEAEVELDAEDEGDVGVLGGDCGREGGLRPLVLRRTVPLLGEDRVLEGFLDGGGEGEAGEVVEGVVGEGLVGLVL